MDEKGESPEGSTSNPSDLATKSAQKPFTGKGEPNVSIGVDGNSFLPGDAAKERRRRGNDRRFKGFPKKKNLNYEHYDLPRIKKDYFDSPAADWYAYCATKGYNPSLKGIPWKTWVREKKYLSAWQGVREEVEREGAGIGPRALLNALRAAKNVPEVAAGMLALTNHCIQVHLREAAVDQKNPTAKPTLTASVMDISMLASAMKATSEVLYKSLGIDTSMGIDPNRWMRMVEENLGRVEGLEQALEETEESKTPKGSTFEIEVLGSQDAQAAIKFATETYLDKLRTAVPSRSPSHSPGEGTEANVVEHVGDDE